MRNYKELFAICKRLGLDYKEEVYNFTNGRTDSLRKLTDGEYLHLCISLNKAAPGDWEPKPGDRVRKKMIAIAKQMQWHDPRLKKEGLFAALDDWCLNQKYKKRLNDLNVEELGVLATIFEKNVLADYLKALNK